MSAPVTGPRCDAGHVWVELGWCWHIVEHGRMGAAVICSTCGVRGHRWEPMIVCTRYPAAKRLTEIAAERAACAHHAPRAGAAVEERP